MNRRHITIETRTVGVRFGTIAVLRDARSGRRLATTDPPRPYGNTVAALTDGEALAARKNWIVEVPS